MPKSRLRPLFTGVRRFHPLKNWGISSEDDAVFAKDEDDIVYRYSDEDEVPEDQEVIEADEAIHMLVTAWSDNDGEVSDEFTSSLDPWS